MSSTASSSLLSLKTDHTHFLSSGSFKPADRSPSGISLCSSYGKSKVIPHQRSLTIKASSDRGAGVFIGGFILGGMVAGTLGCVFAPQISKALVGNDRNNLMKKLTTFLYDEEKALEKKRKILAEKIAQLNTSIDEVSAQLPVDDNPNGATVIPDELQAST